MVKKGLSLEEKRAKILNIYHGTKSIFSLKEIEKAASKQGVVSQTVKVSGKGQRPSGSSSSASSVLQVQEMTMSDCVTLYPSVRAWSPSALVSGALTMEYVDARWHVAESQEQRHGDIACMSVLGTPTLALTVL